MMKMPSQAVLIGGGLVLAAVALFAITRRGAASAVGSAVGGAAVDLVTGTVSGAADATVAAANSDSNPLKGFGELIGETAYNATHWSW